MYVLSNENIKQGPNAIETYCADFSSQLSDGELLTGTPTVVESDSGDTLDISNEARLGTEFTDTLGNTVAANKGVVFTVGNAELGVNGEDESYEITVYCDTTNTPDRVEMRCRITGTRKA